MVYLSGAISQPDIANPKPPLAASYLLYPVTNSDTRIDCTPSPRIDLPSLSEDAIAALPYPPDLYPGGRWLHTPYGVIRMFEFGPADGKPLVFVHGISTPCCVAQDLVDILEKKGGHRILIFDLFGRGWSDTPHLPHDDRLYATQILLVTAAAQADFRRFALVGYSLGGGIAASFARWFPERVTELVLIAPAGLLKSTRLGLASRLAYSGLVPRVIEKVMLKLRTARRHPTEEGTDETKGVEEAGGRKVDIAAVVHWQGSNHKGFLYSFGSSFKYAPIYEREEDYSTVGKHLSEGKMKGECLIIMGEHDDVIEMEVLSDAKRLMGESRVRSRVVKDVAHDLVATKPEEVAKEILEFVDGWEDV